MNKKNIILVVIISIFLVILISVIREVIIQGKNQAIKCPEFYQDEQERMNAMALSMAKYMSSHPNAKAGEVAQARLDFLIDNKCTQTLETIEKENGGIKNYVSNIVSESIINTYKCPSDYATYDEYSKGVLEFGNKYLKNNPEKTYKDVSIERTRLEQENKCKPSTEYECRTAILMQRAYLQTEVLSKTETFDKYKIENVYKGKLRAFNPESNDVLAEFVTTINNQIKNKGVDFAGKYTIFEVGMTGLGTSYGMIDRTNGNGYYFMFKPTFLSHVSTSTLLIGNSKNMIIDFANSMDNVTDMCSSIGDGSNFYTDARPFYLTMENDEIKYIGPDDAQPPMDLLWREYITK
jgi:hypothetical protein